MTEPQRTNLGALAICVSLFFFWGFVTASNSIFIPFCRTYFHLNQFASQLLGSAFYGAYFVGSLILYVVSSSTGFDVFNRYGYKRMIVVGLLISAIGSVLILPSVKADSFIAIMASFFVVALGFSVLQIAAQPFVIGLGPAATGAHRLSLGGSANSLGTILGPIIVSYVLFGTPARGAAVVTLSNINLLYAIVAVIFTAAAVFFHLSALPDQKGESAVVGFGALRYPQVILGAVSIFLYVGVEVTIDNNFGALLRTPGYLTAAGLADNEISKYVSLYWGSVMIGRWTGAVGVFDLAARARHAATIVVPFVAFAVVLLVNRIYGNDVDDLYAYAFCVAAMVIAFFAGAQRPARTLLIVTVLAALTAALGVFSSGRFSVYCFMATGLFASVMWPSIFALGIAGTGRYSGQASAILIMMILGGAVIPPLQGAIGDHMGMHASYVVAVVCFAALAVLARAHVFCLDKRDVIGGS